MTDLSDQLCNDYLDSATVRRLAFLQDARYHAEFTDLRAVLDTVDRLFVDADHGLPQRRAMLRVLLYGANDPEQALDRVREREEETRKEMMRPPSPIVLDKTAWPGK